MKDSIRRLAFVTLFLLGLAGAVAIPFIVGIDESLAALEQAGFLCAVVYVLNSSLAYLIPATSWWLLLRAEKLPVTLLDCVRASLMGFPVSLIMPSMYLGGEPVKAIFVASHCNVPMSTVAGTMMAAKFQETIGLLLFMLISVCGLIVGGQSIERETTLFIAAVVGGLVILLVLTMVAYAKGYKPVSRCVGVLGWFKVGARRQVRFRRRVIEFEESAHRSIYLHWKVFLVAQMICLLSGLSIMLRPYLFIVFSPNYQGGLDLSFLFVVFIMTNVVNLIQITPAGLGTFDAAMVFAFDSVGYSKIDAVAFNVMNRIYDVVLFAVGAWLLVHYGLSRFLRRSGEGTVDGKQYTVDGKQ
jgi:uncharacterized protein (TIRG00374 family)